MQTYTDNVLDRAGNALSNAEVTIYNSDGVTKATLPTNPMTTGSNGEFSFTLANGTYVVSVRHASIPEKTRKVVLFDPADAIFPTADEKAALSGISSPSANNPFPTEADVSIPSASLQDIRDYTGTASVIYAQGHTTAGDGGAGVFRLVTGAAPGTYVDNGGTIVVPTDGDGSAAWLRQYSGALNARWFGATDGMLSTASIQAAIDALPLTGGTVIIDGMFLGTNIRLDGTGGGKSNVVLEGIGWHTGIKKPDHADLNTDADRRSNVVWALTGHGHQVRNMRVEGNWTRGGIKPAFVTKHTLGNTWGSMGRVVSVAADGTSSSAAADDKTYQITATGTGQVSSAVNISFDVAAGYVVEVSQPFNEETGEGYFNAYNLDNDYAYRAAIYLNGQAEPMQGIVVDGVEATDAVYAGILPGAGPLFASEAYFGTLGARISNFSAHNNGATNLGGGKKVAAVISDFVVGKTTSSGIRMDEGSHDCVIGPGYIDTDDIAEANGAVSVYKSHRVTVQGVRAKGALVGFSVTESDDFKAVGYDIDGCRTGMSLTSVDNAEVGVGRVRGATYRGIDVSAGSDIMILGADVSGSTYEGILFDSGTKGGQITAFTSNNGKAGVKVIGANSVNTIGGRHINNHQDGLETIKAGVIYDASSDWVFAGVRSTDIQGVKTQGYGLGITGASLRWSVVANSLQGNATGEVYQETGVVGNALVAFNTGAPNIQYGDNLILSASTGGTTYLLGAAGSENFQVAKGAGTIINRLVAKGGAGGTSTAPSLGPEGTSNDIDLRLIPKGAGKLRFGAHTANADAPITGYLEIKDSAGTLRKLAIID